MQVDQELGGLVQVQELPAAGKMSQIAQAATSKRGTSKAITAQFQTLDPSPAEESEEAAMDIGPFAVNAQVPKQRLSAEERLRRLEEAKAYLSQHLTAHPTPAKVLIKEAKAAGIASRTLHQAKDALGGQVQRQGWGQGGQWLWAAPAGQVLPKPDSLLAAGGTGRHAS